MNEELNQNQNSESTTSDSSNAELDEVRVLNELKKANDNLLKENSDLKEAKREYYDKLLNNNSEPVEVKEVVDTKALIKHISTEELTNLEYVKSVLKLRSALIEQGEEDPFLASGIKAKISEEDREKAERVAKGLQELVDESGDDPEYFVALYNAKVKEQPLPKFKKK